LSNNYQQNIGEIMEELIAEILCNEENRINEAFKDRNYEISNFNIDFHKSDLIELIREGIWSTDIDFNLKQTFGNNEYWVDVEEAERLEETCIKFIDLKSYFDNIIVEHSGSLSDFNRHLDEALQRLMSDFTDVVENLIYEHFKTKKDVQDLIELHELNCSM
ncbi:TPA: hypothetical protein ACN98R_004895, partial [Vibrio parahaemolyticus]